jgi:phosphoribosyl-AMP cyclohydrolase
MRPLASGSRAEYAGDFVPIENRREDAVLTASSLQPDFSKGEGLLPAIAQDADTGEVLMLAYMNAESYAETLATGRAVYFSRSRNRLWRKGEESGNVQQVKSIYLDCDADTILLKVHQIGGAACHEGYKSCFFRQVSPGEMRVVGQRVFDPAAVYKKN